MTTTTPLIQSPTTPALLEALTRHFLAVKVLDGALDSHFEELDVLDAERDIEDSALNDFIEDLQKSIKTLEQRSGQIGNQAMDLLESGVFEGESAAYFQGVQDAAYFIGTGDNPASPQFTGDEDFGHSFNDIHPWPTPVPSDVVEASATEGDTEAGIDWDLVKSVALTTYPPTSLPDNWVQQMTSAEAAQVDDADEDNLGALIQQFLESLGISLTDEEIQGIDFELL